LFEIRKKLALKNLVFFLVGLLICTGCKGPMGPQGKSGTNGQDGIGLVWKGSLAGAPANPQTNWAYYNTGDDKAYIWDGDSWEILAQSVMPTRTFTYKIDSSDPESKSDIFTFVGALKSALNDQSPNNVNTPYPLAISGIDLSAGNELKALYSAITKHVKLDLSGCTGWTIVDAAPSLAENKAKIVELILPDSVTEIETGHWTPTGVFMDFSNLKVFTGNGVTDVGDFAFYNCGEITVNIPAAAYIGVYAFACDAGKAAAHTVKLGNNPPILKYKVFDKQSAGITIKAASTIEYTAWAGSHVADTPFGTVTITLIAE
jgi:hypothetical protein